MHVSSPQSFLPTTIRLSGPFYRPTSENGQDYVLKCEFVIVVANVCSVSFPETQWGNLSKVVFICFIILLEQGGDVSGFPQSRDWIAYAMYRDENDGISSFPAYLSSLRETLSGPQALFAFILFMLLTTLACDMKIFIMQGETQLKWILLLAWLWEDCLLTCHQQ